MCRRLRQAGIAVGIALAAALVTAAPLFAQGPVQQQLSPDDELSPSQVVQPMPEQVTEPTGAPSPSPAAATRAAGALAVRRGAVRTVVECSGPFAKDSSVRALAAAYDARNMIFTNETVQGTEVGVTVLFPKEPRRRLEV